MRHFPEVFQDPADYTWGWTCTTCTREAHDVGSLTQAEDAADVHAMEADTERGAA